MKSIFELGLTISAIARQLNRDRKTVRAHLSGDAHRASSRSDKPGPLDEYLANVSARFVDDPHLWASALLDEVVVLGYASSYVSFAGQVPRPDWAGLRGVLGGQGRETIEIDNFRERRDPVGRLERGGALSGATVPSGEPHRVRSGWSSWLRSFCTLQGGHAFSYCREPPVRVGAEPDHANDDESPDANCPEGRRSRRLGPRRGCRARG